MKDSQGRNITVVGNRTLVTSRGIKEFDGTLYIPKHNLKDSNVCTTEDGHTVIIRDGSGYGLGECRYIVNNENIIAEIRDGKVVPLGKFLLVRKCIDPPDDGEVIASLSKNKTRFAEILAVGNATMLEECIGWLAYVKDDALPQSVEDSKVDWLVEKSQLLMITELEG